MTLTLLSPALAVPDPNTSPWATPAGDFARPEVSLDDSPVGAAQGLVKDHGAGGEHREGHRRNPIPALLH